MKIYNENSCKLRLTELDLDWKFRSNGIEKDYVFKNFKAAFEFMTLAASIAEEINHHPEWSNTYNKVKIRLTTHDFNGLTDKDFELASRIEQIKI